MRSSSLSSNNPLAQSSAALPLPKKNKYQAKKVELDGLRFDSKKEAARYGTLKLLQRAGEISDLKVHPSFDLRVNDQLVCKYIADFSYYLDDMLIVEDVKGMRKGGAWDIFRIKAKLMKALLFIDVVVI